MLVDSQDPPVIRAKQPRNMDYVIKCTYPDCTSDNSSKTCFISVVIYRHTHELYSRNEHERIIQGQLEQSNGNVGASAAKWFEMKSPLKKKTKLTHDDRDGSSSGKAAGGTSGVENDKRDKLTDGGSEDKEQCEGVQFPIFIGDVLIPVLATVKSNPNTIIRLNDLMEFKRDATRPLLSKKNAVGRSSASGKHEFPRQSGAGRGEWTQEGEGGKVTSDQAFASNISKLIDNNLAALTTNVVVVPSKLEAFTKLHIPVRVLLTRHAFQNTKSSESEDDEIRVED
ncbi:hypothetical protein SeLEV6574_g03473 [Synchytrium endobioticum]|uniref:Uncharacterized protein n=1 Tax=Synchytrium endobioticum TaxID=286115 RepID=A0A507D3H9_9FUNG|nr:hypothetical protein SeLEV6574_g03483 [Synchytrium endobioticum]TPX46033.1 hypothetical protein SeLEV6574_g03473 [Synchytrium endobioticum]